MNMHERSMEDELLLQDIYQKVMGEDGEFREDTLKREADFKVEL